MNPHHTQFEDLPIELFGLIFEYLQPHDLLHAFKKLNGRFKSILAQQSLCLPNNRLMTPKLYCNYLTKIIPKYASQIVYLHLSERYAPHAVDWFNSALPSNSRFWPALKAVTIDDVPREVLEILLRDSSFLHKVHSLSLDVGFNRYYCDEYDDCSDFGFIIPILNSLSELRSVNFRIFNQSVYYDKSKPDQSYPRMNIHQNLQILLIRICSKELLVELLDNGHLPQLRQLRIDISSDIHDLMPIDPPNPIPLKQIFVPELRYIRIKLHVCVTWVLTFFEDLQRHSQLDYLYISGHIRFTHKSNFPRVAALKQWLTLSKSNIFKFRMKLSADYALDAMKVQEDIFDEYQQAFGDESTSQFNEMNILYPEMFLSHPMIMDEKNSIESDDFIPDELMDESNSTMDYDYFLDESVDENVEEIKLDVPLEELHVVPCWYRLKKIHVEGYWLSNINLDGDNIPQLLHIIQRSPQFRELHIESTMKYARVLSSNIELGILLINQLEVLHFTIQESKNSFRKLLKIVDTLFGYSTSSSRLKQLTLIVEEQPGPWLSTKNIVRWLRKIFKRFPGLIHLILSCRPTQAYENSQYNFSELCFKWPVMSLIARQRPSGFIEYRHNLHSIDIWL